ncbi:MAG: NTP transferase domain-containing protein [Thermoplasmata archaeon]|nr:NTP transferase domain-containing protein [Thermoplasmata archaeon]
MSGGKVEQVVILCGGLGTRLKDVSKDIPKSMMPIGDRPFLEIQVSQFKHYGITRFLFLTSHLHEVIEDHFGDGSKFGVQIEYSTEPEPLGTGGALALAEDKLDDVFYLTNGDTILPIDPTLLDEGFHKQKCLGFITIYDNHEKVANKNAIIDDHGQVLLYSKLTSLPEMTGVEAGLSVFDKKILKICKKDNYSLEMEVFPKLINNGRLFGLKTSQRFYDIGTPERLELARSVLNDLGW